MRALLLEYIRVKAETVLLQGSSPDQLDALNTEQSFDPAAFGTGGITRNTLWMDESLVTSPESTPSTPEDAVAYERETCRKPALRGDGHGRIQCF